MDAQLKIIVGADIGDVDKKLQALEKQAAFLKKQLEKPINASFATDIAKQLDVVNKQINELNQKKLNLLINPGSASALDNLSNSLNKAKQGSAQATTALTNLSRVAQDAPFGFIGIANNIDPLLQSFQSLKKETGSTGSALKALGASLAGPAGIAVGLSVVTALVTVAIQKYGSLSNALGVLFGSISNAEQAQRELNLAIAENEGKADAEIATITALVSIAKDKALSDNARQQAIDKLNKQYDDYLPKLSLENIGSLETAQAVDKLTAALFRQAKIRGAQSYIEEQFKALSKLKVEQSQAAEEVVKSAQDGFFSLVGLAIKGGAGILGRGIGSELVQASNATKGIEEKIKVAQNALRSFLEDDAKAGTLNLGGEEQLNQLDKLKDSLTKLKGKLSVETNPEQIKFLQTEIKKVENQIKKLKGEKFEINTSVKKDKVTSKEAAQMILQIENDLAADISKIQEKTITNERQLIKQRFETRLLELKKGYDKERAEAAAKIYENEEDKKKVLAAIDAANLTRVLAVKTELRFELEKYDKSFFDFTKKIREKVDKDIRDKPISQSWPVEIQARIKANDKQLSEDLRAFRSTIESTIESGLTESFAAIGETVGDLFSGGNFGQKLAKGGEAILKIIGGVLQSLGKEVIKAGVIVQLLKKQLASLIANPGASLAVGISLVALGQVLKNIKLAKVPALAEGGIVNGPTLSLIGERGSEAVIPLDKLNGMMVAAVRSAINPAGARGLATTGDQRLVTEIRGSSLALVLQRTNNTASRLG